MILIKQIGYNHLKKVWANVQPMTNSVIVTTMLTIAAMAAVLDFPKGIFYISSPSAYPSFILYPFTMIEGQAGNLRRLPLTVLRA